MKLIACSACHTQYDVSDVATDQIRCRCGSDLDLRERREAGSADLAVHRCSSCGAHVAVGDDGCDYCGSEIVRDPRLLSLICPECCARNATASRFCGSCGVVFDPQSVEEDFEALPCPVCSCLMAARTVGGVGISECPKCNGIWCPEDRFTALVERALEAKRRASEEDTSDFEPRVKGSNPAGQGVQYRKCPTCDGFMQRRNFRKSSGVIIDRCNRHGTWLDADELEQIAGYVLSGGRPRAEAAMRYAEQRDKAELLRARLTTEDARGFQPLTVARRSDDSYDGDGWRGVKRLIESLLD